MKKLSLAGLVLVGCVFSSCSKDPEVVLPRQDGKWTYTGTYTEKENGTLVGSANFSGTFIFNDNKSYTGTMSLDENHSLSGQWSLSGEESISLTNFEDFFDNNETITFKLSDLKRNSQTWTYTLVDGGEELTAVLKLSKQ